MQTLSTKTMTTRRRFFGLIGGAALLAAPAAVLFEEQDNYELPEYPEINPETGYTPTYVENFNQWLPITNGRVQVVSQRIWEAKGIMLAFRSPNQRGGWLYKQFQHVHIGSVTLHPQETLTLEWPYENAIPPDYAYFPTPDRIAPIPGIT